MKDFTCLQVFVFVALMSLYLTVVEYWKIVHKIVLTVLEEFAISASLAIIYPTTNAFNVIQIAFHVNLKMFALLALMASLSLKILVVIRDAIIA